MAWKDIDIEVIGKIDEERYWEVVKKLFHTPYYKRLFVANFTNSLNPNTPKGLHVCLEEYGKTEKNGKLTFGFYLPENLMKKIIMNGSSIK